MGEHRVPSLRFLAALTAALVAHGVLIWAISRWDMGWFRDDPHPPSVVRWSVRISEPEPAARHQDGRLRHSHTAAVPKPSVRTPSPKKHQDKPVQPHQTNQSSVARPSLPPRRTPKQPSRKSVGAPRSTQPTDTAPPALSTEALLSQVDSGFYRDANPKSRSALVGGGNLADAYSAAVIRKLERFAERFIPERLKQVGQGPVVEVNIRFNGRVSAVRVLKSSGNRELDEMVVRAYYLNAPYAPFGAALKKQHTMLSVRQRWMFVGG